MCGCNSNKSVPVIQTITPKVYDDSCGVTLQQIKDVRESLLNMKTPENTGYINARLGELLTMENSGRYCLYPL